MGASTSSQAAAAVLNAHAYHIEAVGRSAECNPSIRAFHVRGADFGNNVFYVCRNLNARHRDGQGEWKCMTYSSWVLPNEWLNCEFGIAITLATYV